MAIGGYVTRGVGGGGTLGQYMLSGLGPKVTLTGGSTGYQYAAQTPSTVTYTYTR